MNDAAVWEAGYRQEIRRGIEARAAGNEGMARVCARRAAGVLVRAYFESTDRSSERMSALNLLRALRDSPEPSETVRATAGHFIVQITEEHVLPGDIDLLAEAERLREALFPSV